MKLSQHFTLEEATRSSLAIRKGILNVPPSGVLTNMLKTAGQLEMVRHLLRDQRILVTSWYRCTELNHLVGSSPTSSHVLGWAVDFISPDFGSPLLICRAILDADISFDQLIHEGAWVHISFDPRMRQQALTAHFHRDRPTTYTAGV